MFVLLRINCRDHDFVVDHILSVLELGYFGLPTDKRSEVVIVDQEVEDGLSFGQVDNLGYFSP